MENVPDKEAIVSPDTERKDRVPPGQHAVTSWPVLHYGPVRRYPLTSGHSIYSGSWTKSGLSLTPSSKGCRG